MKIAIEAQRIFRKKKHGMDIVALELIRHLQKIDQENIYYILVKPDEDRTVLRETGNFRIIEIPAAPYPIWEQVKLPTVIKKLNPDILHCTSNTGPVAIDIPMILTLHDIIYMGKINFTKGSWYQRFGNLYRRLVVPRIIHNCHKITTVSEFERQRITDRFSLPAENVETIYNAYNPLFHPITDKIKLDYYRQKYRLPEQYLLFLGNTEPKKNFTGVIRALDLLHKSTASKIPLVMPDIGRTFLKRTLRQIGNPSLEESIHLTGYIPNDELVYLYNMAAVFLYPSFYESFGIPILEAMACNTPVITSKTAAMPEISGKAAILTDPHRPEDICKAILSLLENTDLRATCRENGLERANSFNWEQTATAMLGTYRSVYNKLERRQSLKEIAA